MPVCPLCGRDIPKEQADAHHIVPKLKGDNETKLLHRIWHRQIHALFTEVELANHYNQIDVHLQVDAIQKFVHWIKTKPIYFSDSVKRSNRKK